MQQQLQRQRLIPQTNAQQQEQYGLVLQRCKQQITVLYQQINQALQQMSKQHQPAQVQPNTDNKDVKSIADGLNMLNIGKEGPQQPTSRLMQWKQPKPDDNDALNKAPGSKPIQQSHSSPNLQAKIDPLGSNSLSIGLDNPVWSTTSSSKDWPETSAINSSLISQSGSKSSVSNSSSSITDMIPEFVPGKPWAGLSSMKSVEEDPHMTPSSVSHSLSVNTIRSDVLAKTSSGPPSADSASSIWSSRQLPQMATSTTGRSWSSGNNNNEMWQSQQGGMARRPPPGLNRSVSVPEHVRQNVGPGGYSTND